MPWKRDVRRNRIRNIHWFIKINVSSVPDKWDFKPTGGGDKEGLTFRLFWIESKGEV